MKDPAEFENKEQPQQRPERSRQPEAPSSPQAQPSAPRPAEEGKPYTNAVWYSSRAVGLTGPGYYRLVNDEVYFAPVVSETDDSRASDQDSKVEVEAMGEEGYGRLVSSLRNKI